jgi:DNA primase
MAAEAIEIEAAGRKVRLSNPGKVFFPEPGYTKLDLANYYIEVEEGTVRGLRERPGTMKRFVDGVDGDFFFQKRVPKGAPDWLRRRRSRSRADAAPVSLSPTTPHISPGP